MGTANLTDSTVSGNSAGGGGVSNFVGTANLTDSTVSGNSASSGGGVLNGRDYSGRGYTVTLARTLVSGNTALRGAEVFDDYQGSGQVTAGDFNLFGHAGLSNAQAFSDFSPGASDITATSDGTTPTALAAILDTTLMNNGGSAQTHALVAGSPGPSMR